MLKQNFTQNRKNIFILNYLDHTRIKQVENWNWELKTFESNSSPIEILVSIRKKWLEMKNDIFWQAKNRELPILIHTLSLSPIYSS